jgi:hypothetical protein
MLFDIVGIDDASVLGSKRIENIKLLILPIL